MPDVALKRADGIAYREAAPARPSQHHAILCVHGWPQSSYMWRHLLPALASAGHRALALDLAGYGDSPPDRPGTWEHHLAAFDRFYRQLELERVVLVVHDTGGGVGLRWACDNPQAIAGLVISNTGFFPDYEFAEIARIMRTPVQGEALLDSISHEGFATLLREISSGIDDAAVDEYWKAFGSADRRRAMLELYRSLDLDELKPYQGRLGMLGVPTLIIWGERDDYIPRDYASRFATEIPGARLVMLEHAYHFLFEDEPERCTEEVIGFLQRAAL